MGNHPSQEYVSRPVVRVPAQPRAEPTPTPGYKQRPAPRPPTRVPSYKNPYYKVLPGDVPNGILRNRNTVNIPLEDYSDDDHDAGSELDEPNDQFELGSHRSDERLSSSLGAGQFRSGNYTPNGEIIKGRQSLQFEVGNGPKKSMVLDNRHLVNGMRAPMRKDSPRSASNDSPRSIQNGNVRVPMDSPRGRERTNEPRVTFAASQDTPALGEVVRPIRRKQKGRAPPPPRPPPPGAKAPAPAAPTPPVVLPFKESSQQNLPPQRQGPSEQDLSRRRESPENNPPRREASGENPKSKRLTATKPSLHEQLQADIINAAKARQGRDPIEPPKIQKPKSGEEEFRDQLIKVCKRIESYPGEDTDAEGHTTGRDSEWETTYDPNDYKPKTTAKFLVNTNYKFNSKQVSKQSESPASQSSQKSAKALVKEEAKPAESPKVARNRSQSIDSVLGGSINIIPTRVEQTLAEWTPDQDLDDIDMDNDRNLEIDKERRGSGSAIFGPGVRMNMSESSMGSVRMYRSKSTDQGKPDKPNRFQKHRNSDASIRSKGSMRSLKDSIRSAFSSIGTSTKNRKERKPVKGYFEQNGYRYGPNIQPVMYYHPGDPHQFYQQGFYPMPYQPVPMGPHGLSPTVPYGGPWFEDPYRMYPPRPVPMQPILVTDGMHRRALSMEELDYPAAYGQLPMYAEPRARSKSREREKTKQSNYRGSWSSLKDDIQYDHGSISRSWRRLKARGRSRTKSRDNIDDWNLDRGAQNDKTDSSDDEESLAPLPRTDRDGTPHDVTSRHQDVNQRPGNRRRPHGKKNGAGVSSSSDENKPPSKLLRSQDSVEGLPPSGNNYKSRYRKKGIDVEL